MSEIVYPPVIAAAKLLFRALDLRITVQGADHIPRTGGAVIACNHVSYLDFIFCGFGARPPQRLVRFMAKKEVFRHRICGPLMRGHAAHPGGPRRRPEPRTSTRSTRCAPARSSASSRRRRSRRSFTVKEIQVAVRRGMAASAGVPLIPMALWGTQRLWTKGRPRHFDQAATSRSLIAAGEPFDAPKAARDNQTRLAAELRSRMPTCSTTAQARLPWTSRPGRTTPGGMPAHLGGTAPTPAEADALDATPVPSSRRQLRRTSRRSWPARHDRQSVGRGAASRGGGRV